MMFRGRVWLIFVALFSLAGSSWAQNSAADLLGAPGVDLSQPGQRARIVGNLNALMTQRTQAARIKARQLGLPLRLIQANGRIMEIADFAGNKPVYFTTHNANAAISSGANLIQAPPYSVTGSGTTVGVWDGGGIRTSHQELNGRVTIKDGAALVDHSTHVGGTIGAWGAVAAAKGMAPSIMIDSYEWTSDRSEMTSRGASYPGEPGKIYLSNHSYGYVSGWNYTGLSSPRWTWYGTGTTATGVETDFGKYETNARDTDSVAVSLPYYLMVRSAGNERLDNPATDDPVSLSTSTSSAVPYNPATHPPGDGVYKGNGYDSVSYDAVAKNVLTVGSVGDAVVAGVRNPGSAYMSSYSSWGPTDDGRLKPDMVANGEALYSSLASSDSAYGTYSGTSMATPSVTGSAALLVGWWGKLFPGHALRASTLKALLIETADDLGNPGPDYQYGWGLINLKAAADLAQSYKDSPGTHRVIEDQLTTTTSSRSYSFTWDGISPIRAVLCWTDPAGQATTSSDLRTARLVNNLDLKINGPTGTVHQPWVMPYVGDWTTAKLSAPATTGVNNTDNVEQVHLASPPAPGVYTAVVSFSGTLTNSAQVFSLILSGGVSSVTAPPPVASAVSPNVGTIDTMTLSMTGSAFLPGANVKLTKTGQADVQATGQEELGDSVKFRVNVNGMAQGAWNVVLTNPDGQTTTLPNAFNIAGALWQDNLETGAAGWTHSASVGTSTLWALSTTKSNSATHAFFASGPALKNVDDLNSPSINIPAGASNLRLTFWHNYAFQSGRDGGVLEFSLNNGTWFDANSTGSGASFASGGYTTTLSAAGNPNNRNPLSGQPAWSGSNAGFTQVAVDLTDSAKYAGKSLKIRWRLATDGGTASTGWYIDDISLAGAGLAVNLQPSVTADASATPSPVTGVTTQLTVAAADDAGESALTYTWTAAGGSFDRPVTFSENGSNAAKVTTATFTKAGTYNLNVVIRDAEGLTASSNLDVVVNQTASSISVTPPSVTLPYGSTQTFTTSEVDQFADPLDTLPVVTWSTNGGGTIDATGLFTANAVGGPYLITAMDGVLTGNASLTVSKAVATINLSNLTQVYDGNPKSATINTVPSGLTVSTSYNGASLLPVDFGNYAVSSTITDPNYQGSATGTLTITGEPLATWLTTHFTSQEIDAGLGAATADFDLDGLTNLAEYALGTDPRSFTPGLKGERGPDNFVLTFIRPKSLPDVTYTAESSDDMVTWNPIPIMLVTDGPIQTMRAIDPMTSGNPDRRFIRLRFAR